MVRPGVKPGSHAVTTGRAAPSHTYFRPLPRSSTHVQPSQERLPRAHRLLQDQDNDPDPEPDRDPEEVIRAVPADEPAAFGARRRRSAVGFQVGLPDLRLPRELV